MTITETLPTTTERKSETARQDAVFFENVSFSYNGQAVLTNVNLAVPKGEFMAIVGPNGGGKTTLLKLILGLVRPSTGSVRVFGESPENGRSLVGYMPQFGNHDLQFPVTVMDVVLMGRVGRAFGGRYSKQDKAEALTALEEMEMAGYRTSPFMELSGGQRQRVLIARALAGNPSLLLLDEPTANVDPRVEIKLFETLQRLNARMTILMVSHDLGFVSNVMDSVICVNRQVVIHPVCELTGDTIREIYGGDLNMIRHDHRCSDKGHQHD